MNTPEQRAWSDMAHAVDFDGRAFIDGVRAGSKSRQTFEKHSPVDGRLLGTVARCDGEDIDLAVTAARRAFNDGRWVKLAPGQRKRVLIKWSELIMRDREQLALLETLDMGKPIQRSFGVDVASTANCIAWYGEAIDKLYDEVAPTSESALALITREPVGVVGAIVPWNYPLIMAAWKLGPALAAGNSVVLKPSEKSPYSALRLAELALEAGIPPGVFNVVPGYGQEAGEALSLHMDVDVIVFTGSTRIGRRMFASSSSSNLKRVYNELGGKSAFLVFDDYRDVERAAQAAVGSIYFNQGESCNAPSRVLVQRSRLKKFTEIAVELARKSYPQTPLTWGAPMGALVDDVQVKSVMRFVESGLAEGANLLCGGKTTLEHTGGCYVEPTVFADVTNRMEIAREEIFGPVLSILAFDSEEEGIAIANDSVYGLQAAVWSDDLSRAHRVSRRLKAGTVHVNQYDEDDITVPFGGVKQSGNGRDKSLHAFDKYTDMKTTWVRID